MKNRVRTTSASRTTGSTLFSSSSFPNIAPHRAVCLSALRGDRLKYGQPFPIRFWPCHPPSKGKCSVVTHQQTLFTSYSVSQGMMKKSGSVRRLYNVLVIVWDRIRELISRQGRFVYPQRNDAAYVILTRTWAKTFQPLYSIPYY